MTLEEKYKGLQDNPYFQYFSIKSEWENRNKSPEQLGKSLVYKRLCTLRTLKDPRILL